jgi:hypothetical protein
MSMPIQRQSDSFGVFDNGPRYERDRTSTDLPRGLAALINTSGPRIQGGMLNTRLAVNTDGMDPDSHAYHTERRVDGPGPGRIYNPDFREYEPSEQDERDQEGVAEDDESGYNWGPEPRRASRHPFDRAAACQECGEEIEPESGWEWTHSGDDYYEHNAEPSPEDEAGRAAWEEERGIGGRNREGSLPPHTAGAWADLFGEDGPDPFEGKDPDKFFTDWLERGDEDQHRHRESARRFVAFDWKPDHASNDTERHRAALENGHVLAIQDHGKYGWNWTMFAPAGHMEGMNGGPPETVTELVTGGGARWKGLPGFYSTDHIPTREHARQQAEEAYKRLYPIGTDTGGHDSGTDYSDLSGYLRHLEGRRVALAPAVSLGHGYLPAHRVGLDWRDTTIPGTVISLDGEKIGVRWDDGQYSSEHPHEVRLL